MTKGSNNEEKIKSMKEVVINKTTDQKIIDKNVKKKKNLEEKVADTNQEPNKDTEKQTKIKIAKEKVMNKKVGEDSFDFSAFQAATSKHQRRDAEDGAGTLSVLYNKNGMNVTVGAAVYEKIGSPEKLQFAFSKNEVAVFQSLPNNDNYFIRRGKGKKAIIYSSDLVREISDRYNLEFGYKTMKTFYNVRYETNEGITIAIIKIRNQQKK